MEALAFLKMSGGRGKRAMILLEISQSKYWKKFSLVTRFARETTSQLFRESQSNGFGAVERKNYSHSSLDIPPKIPKDPEEVPIQSTLPSDPLEVTSCALWKLYNLVLQGNYLDI